MLAGIAGQPVAHSLSPVIHNAWLQAGDIDGAYMPFAPKDAAGFDTLIAAGRAGLVQGLNVTAPFKEQAFALAPQLGAARINLAQVLMFKDRNAEAVVLLEPLVNDPHHPSAGAREMLLRARGMSEAEAEAEEAEILRQGEAEGEAPGA